MRLLASLMVLLALGGAAYNYYQIGRLRDDIRVIRGEVTAVEVVKRDPSELRAALDRAERHAMRARKLLSQGKPELASKELDLSLRMLEKASSLSRGEDDRDGLGKTLERIRAEIQKAWKDTINEAKKGERK